MLRKLLLTLFVAGAMCTAASASGGWRNHVIFTNKTPDAWVWVTMYAPSGQNLGTMCVGPQKTETRVSDDYSTYEVRAEVTQGAGCSGHRWIDRLRGYPKGAGNSYHYYVHGSNGKYDYNETP